MVAANSQLRHHVSVTQSVTANSDILTEDFRGWRMAAVKWEQP